MDPIESYIRNAATQRGIDPDQAMRVARSEGFNSYTGDNGSSFGPFQLHYGGVAPGGNRVSGLGDVFTAKTGLDARDPATIPQQIDFALDHAAQNGWGPWHGWKGDQWAGIKQQADSSNAPASSPPTMPGAAPVSAAPQAAAAPGNLSAPENNPSAALSQIASQIGQQDPLKPAPMMQLSPLGASRIRASMARGVPFPAPISQALLDVIGGQS